MKSVPTPFRHPIRQAFRHRFLHLFRSRSAPVSSPVPAPSRQHFHTCSDIDSKPFDLVSIPTALEQGQSYSGPLVMSWYRLFGESLIAMFHQERGRRAPQCMSCGGYDGAIETASGFNPMRHLSQTAFPNLRKPTHGLVRPNKKSLLTEEVTVSYLQRIYR